MKTPEEVYWKLRTISRELGISESTLKRKLSKSNLKLLKYKGATCLPKTQINVLSARLFRSNDEEAIVIYLNKGHACCRIKAHNKIDTEYNQQNHAKTKRKRSNNRKTMEKRTVRKS